MQLFIIMLVVKMDCFANLDKGDLHVDSNVIDPLSLKRKEVSLIGLSALTPGTVQSSVLTKNNAWLDMFDY